MRRLFYLSTAVLLSACSVPVETTAPPTPQEITVFLASPPSQVACLEESRILPEPLGWEALKRSQRSLPLEKPRRPRSPEAVVRVAEQLALVQPTERGYFGGSVVQRYPWVANKIYTIYVSAKRPTKITLPPGEYADANLPLDGQDWEVSKQRIVKGESRTDVFFVRPWLERGQVDMSIITEAGHSFDLRLIVSPAGMFGVEFTTMPVTTVEELEPPLHARPLR